MLGRDAKHYRIGNNSNTESKLLFAFYTTDSQKGPSWSAPEYHKPFLLTCCGTYFICVAFNSLNSA